MDWRGLLTRPLNRIVLLERGNPVNVKSDRLVCHSLRNTGRDLGAFLWYIVHHYDTLDGVYLFTSGNLSKHRRMQRCMYLLNDNHQCFASVNNRKSSLGEEEHFKISSYMGCTLVPANVRGRVLHQHSKEFFQTLLTQTEIHNNTEVVHYIERAAYAIFGPSTWFSTVVTTSHQWKKKSKTFHLRTPRNRERHTWEPQLSL